MLPGLAGLSYRESLDWMGLSSLDCRKLWADLIKVYRIVSGMDQVDVHSLLARIQDSKTGVHRIKMRGERFKGNFRALRE